MEPLPTGYVALNITVGALSVRFVIAELGPVKNRRRVFGIAVFGGRGYHRDQPATWRVFLKKSVSYRENTRHRPFVLPNFCPDIDVPHWKTRARFRVREQGFDVTGSR